MEIRITDWLIGLAGGYYLVPTILIFGMTVHWVLVALFCMYAYRGLKKFGRFLKKQIVVAVVKELNKQNDLNM
ncbi:MULTISPECIES: hypothetical protein [Bacillus cereus group]|jgi:O-antigen/teichoic acid export membrane protein|uniref:hypothetical protein n=1 Tax=Bacillus cereus group TaxID=86661 RepID=UPI000BF563E1|nr:MULTISPECIES: hypothetical protein [Bacillus cereus group]NUH91274.1 hypothetical protein [Bacillus thuringiensis]NUH96688.1 hypothetical protein [Bacillus thuringiensis]NUI02006.1 hypothetical protein [Bacillus thuringiensis]NUI07218.1 hypothetical protein [Bacillus thuringiensis]NUI15227.1 hypothetical protein [Bacillus thuringiensis]